MSERKKEQEKEDEKDNVTKWPAKRKRKEMLQGGKDKRERDAVKERKRRARTQQGVLRLVVELLVASANPGPSMEVYSSST
jgi:hypothetical protein